VKEIKPIICNWPPLRAEWGDYAYIWSKPLHLGWFKRRRWKMLYNVRFSGVRTLEATYSPFFALVFFHSNFVESTALERSREASLGAVCVGVLLWPTHRHSFEHFSPQNNMPA
jgi:hypothetical protein